MIIDITQTNTERQLQQNRDILPIRVIKIGSDDRPATSTDIANVQQQLAQVVNDPDLVTCKINDWAQLCFEIEEEALAAGAMNFRSFNIYGKKNS